MASLAGATRVHRADTSDTEGSFPGAQSFHKVGSGHRATAEGSTVRLTPPSTSSLGKWGRPGLSTGSRIWGSHLRQVSLWKPRPATLCPHLITSRGAASHMWCRGGVGSCAHGPLGLPVRWKTPRTLLIKQDTKIMYVLVYQQKINTTEPFNF